MQAKPLTRSEFKLQLACVVEDKLKRDVRPELLPRPASKRVPLSLSQPPGNLIELPFQVFECDPDSPITAISFML